MQAYSYLCWYIIAVSGQSGTRGDGWRVAAETGCNGAWQNYYSSYSWRDPCWLSAEEELDLDPKPNPKLTSFEEVWL